MSALTEHIETQYAGAATASLDTSGVSVGSFSVGEVSGDILSAVFTLQTSSDGSRWDNTSSTVTGEGIATGIDFEGVAFARLSLTTASSASATARVTIYAERA